MTQPSQVIQIDMNTLKKEVLKEQIIQGNFDVNNYTSKEFGSILETVKKYLFQSYIKKILKLIRKPQYYNTVMDHTDLQ